MALTTAEHMTTGVEVPSLPQGTDLGASQLVIRRLHQSKDSDVYETWSLERLCNCVVKRARLDAPDPAKARDRLLAEGAALSSLSHPHLVRCYEVHEDLDGHAALVLERLQGPTAHLIVHRLGTLVPWPDLITWGVQLASAVHHMHGRGLLHLDIKPGNVVIDGQRATLLDLHIARGVGPIPAGMGTRGYAAPEQIRGDDVTPVADVWGLAAVLYELAAGRAIYPVATIENFVPPPDWTPPQLEGAPPSVRTFRNMPERLCDLFDDCLQLDPAARPSLDEFIARLSN